MLRVNVDGQILMASAVGIGHIRKDLVVVTADGQAKEFGYEWQRLSVTRPKAKKPLASS